MSARAEATAEILPAVEVMPAPEGVLQRQCVCGQHTPSGSSCPACSGSRTFGASRRSGVRTDAELKLPGLRSARSQAAVQPKLIVTAPGDEHEREADRLAERVLRAPISGTRSQPDAERPLLQPGAVTPVQTSDPSGEEKLRRKPLRDEEEEEEGTVHPRRTTQAPSEVAPEVEANIRQGGGEGEPLPASLHEFFGSRFGQDFSRVRIHTGPEAQQSARALGAQAFTRGQEIFFGAGYYRPETEAGRLLLAHELAHTLQQRGENRGPAVVQRRTEGGVLAPARGPAAPAPAPASSTPATAVPTTANAPLSPAPAAPAARAEAAPPPPSGAPPGVPPSAPGALPGAPPESAAPSTAGETSPNGAAATEEQPAQASSPGGQLLQSLATVPASGLGTAYGQVSQAAAQLQIRERAEVQANLPEIVAPTGLPRQEPPPTPTAKVGEGRAPDAPTPGSREGAPPDTHVVEPSAPPPTAQMETRVPEPVDDGGGSWWEWLMNAVRRFLGRLPTSDPNLSTAAGARPRVDLTGDADPKQGTKQRKESDREVQDRRAEADATTHADFGENGIYPSTPDRRLRATLPARGREGARGAPGANGSTGLPANVRDLADHAAAPHVQGQVGEQVRKERLDREQYERDSQEAKDESRRQLENETARVRREQEAERRGAREEVTARREEWRKENREAQEAYERDAGAEQTETNRQIKEKVRTSEEQADQELTKTEQRAEEERRRTEREAEAKRREAESRPRSWWDRVKGAISDAFDRIREAVNDLFDALREKVRGWIRAAKQFVSGLIERARQAIVGMILAFGEALKGFVRAALVLFPDAADRACAWIDARIEGAVETVNEAAAALQEFAAALLDALGEALDFIISVYQKAFNIALSVMEFLVIGLAELMERLGYLVEAAGQMPDHFRGQMEEELIGRDLGEPFPFERTAQPNAGAAMPAAVAIPGGRTLPLSSGALPAPTTGTPAPISDGQLAVDSVAKLELDPELVASLGLADGGEIEFGESNDPTRTLASVQQELKDQAALQPGAATAPAPPAAEVTPMEGDASTEGEAGTAAPGTAADTEEAALEPAEPPDPEKELQELMQQSPQGGCTKEKKGEPAQPEQIPEEARKGPFTRGQRARYLLNQMWKGIKQWFDCNWPWLLAAAIAALAVLVVAEILTGGAITAALPVLLELIALILIGVALIRVAAYVGEYLVEGWQGNTGTAAKRLARGLAVGAIELVFALLFDLGAVIKAAKAGVAGTLRAAATTARSSVKTLAQSGRRLGRAAFRTVRNPGQAARLVGRVALRRGRVFMKGLTGSVGRGIRSLDEFARRLWEWVRFRKFKLRLHGRRFELWGYINPWILLASGELVKVPTTGGRPMLGESYSLGRRKGILVGVAEEEPSAMVAAIEGMTDAERRSLYRRMASGTAEDARKFLVNRETTAELRKGISGLQPPFFNAHHIVPRELRKNNRLMDFLEDLKFGIEDGARNGVMLPPSRELAKQYPGWAKASLHYTSHGRYTSRVETRLMQIARDYQEAVRRGVPRGVARTEAIRQLDTYLARLKTGLMKGEIPLN